MINVKDHGAVGDGVTDDSAAFQNAVIAAGADTVIQVPEGLYNKPSRTLVENNGVYFQGESEYASQILFNPIQGEVCFHFTKGPEGIWNPGVEKIGIRSTDTAAQKIAVQADDFHGMRVRDFLCSGFQNKDSIGLYLRGRDTSSFDVLSITADIPVRIGVNPNTTEWLDADHFHFSDTGFNVGAVAGNLPRAAILVDDGVQMHNLTVDGYNAWAHGHGFYSVSTAGTKTSSQIKLSGIRHEQSTDPNHWFVKIQRPPGARLQGLVVENCRCSTPNGVFVRNADWLSFRDFQNGATLTTWDIDDCTEVVRENSPTFADAAPYNLSLTEVFTPHRPHNPAVPRNNHPATAFYSAQTTGKWPSYAEKPANLFGTPIWSWNGELGQWGQIQLPINDQQNNVGAAILFVVASDENGVVESGMWQLATASGLNNGVAKVTGTTNTTDVDTGVNLAVYCSGPSPIANNVYIRNRLGVACQVAAFAFYAPGK